MAEQDPRQVPRAPNITKFGGKLIIATSFYQSQSHAMYTNSLVHTAVVLERCGVNWEFWPVNGDFHVERAVNGVLARFLYDEEATDILLIDSDESWDFMAVMRLLARTEEVVGCAYRMKNNWEKYTCQIQMKDGVPQGYVLPDNTALLRAERLPGGFMRIKKTALQKFVAAHPDEWFYYDVNGESIKVPMFFESRLRDHVFFSCDFDFCEKLKAIGVELWLDPNADIVHYGMTAYPGNLDKSLRSDKQKREESKETQKAFGVVKQMAEEIKARAA